MWDVLVDHVLAQVAVVVVTIALVAGVAIYNKVAKAIARRYDWDFAALEVEAVAAELLDHIQEDPKAAEKIAGVVEDRLKTWGVDMPAADLFALTKKALKELQKEDA